MTARDLYRDTLKELDKFESPTFTIRDFNYFGNKGISEYIDLNYRQLDVVQKDIDDVRGVFSLDTPLEMASDGTITLPDGYRHMLHVKIKVKFIKAMGKYKVNDLAYFYPERMKSGEKGFRFKNAFGRPNFKRYYYQLDPTKFRLLFDDTVVSIPTGTNLWLDFIKMGADIYLDPNEASDYNDPTKNSILFFSPGTSRTHVYFEIVNQIRKIFLENIESMRSQEAKQQALTQ